MPRAAPHLARDCNSIVATVLSSDAREMRRCALHDRPLSLFRNRSIPYGVPGAGLGHATRSKVIIGDFSGPIADLASCRAVVTNGGFSLILEAVFLHKPECTIPISAQFEQWLNAAEVEQIGHGRHFAKITVNNLRAFFYGFVGFDTALAGYRQQGNEVLFAELDATLKETITEHLPAEVE